MASKKKNLGPLTFGLDIGIASVGWAVLGENRIIDLGVRCFDAAEDPKTGDSLNEHRRLMKTQRNRLHRRVLRLKKLRRLLRDIGAVPNANIENFTTTSSKKGNPARSEPWELRAKGLDEKLDGADWARVLYHIIKHRGFYAARKSETVDDNKEGGKLTKGVKRTAALMQGKWRTLGEMAAKDEAFLQTKRNKAGSYLNSFSRSLLDEELRKLFESQHNSGNPYASAELEQAVLELLWYQKPSITGKAMLEMIGRCTFEKDEYRAPKRSFSAERFVWLSSKLNNIKIIQAGERRSLTPGELQVAKDLPYRLAKVTYKQLRRAIGLSDSPNAGFAGLPYSIKRNKKGELVDPEEATLIELKGWHDLKKELDNEATRHAWERLSGNALAGNPIEMDAIALALSIYKSDEELKLELAKLNLDAVTIEAILRVDYSNFIQLSNKAITKLMPHLEAGLRYDEACSQAGYNHAKPNEETSCSKYLPAFNLKEIRNPVVFRALNQTRKVLNALIADYRCSPVAIHVELARDLSKTWEERKEIEAGQKEFQVEKQATVDYFIEQVGRSPKGDELLKMRLYREQDGQCAYSLHPLALDGDIRRIFEDNTTQIDHILPYSRSFDDSQNNKVLVLTKQNQNKGNQTPFEFMVGVNQSSQWRNFEAWVRGHKNIRKAKRDRLLRKSFTTEEAEGFKSRNLNDTRYITRYFADYVRQRLQFAPDASGQIKPRESRVLCPAGGYTNFLRARWGLTKNRAASDLHHALDACVIAAATRSLQKRVSNFSRKGELVQLPDGTFADKETGEILNAETATALGERFPQPWPHFREEVQARLSANPSEIIREYFSTYDESVLAGLKPVLISRAIKHRAGGPVHQDTVRSKKSHLGKDTSSKRVRLEGLKIADLDNIVGAHDGRNEALIDILRNRLEAHKGDGKKAFGPNMPPVHKPRRDGTPGPLIRAIKIKDVQKGGVPVRGGIADQASIWRVDVFHKTGKFYLIPIYQSDRRKNGVLPSRAATANTPRDEWTMIDESFDFKFSLFPNDLVKLKNRNTTFFGYFVGLGVATASISIRSHDNNESIATGKAWQGVWVNLGVKIGIRSFEKFHVDVLGNFYPAPPEKRRDLA
jgi:CRISPR-associated endonuclease Csn1